MASLVTVVHIWKCSHCPREVRQEYPLPAGIQMVPPSQLTLPPGWTIRDAAAYCDHHDVTVWPRIRDRFDGGSKDAA